MLSRLGLGKAAPPPATDGALPGAAAGVASAAPAGAPPGAAAVPALGVRDEAEALRAELKVIKGLLKTTTDENTALKAHIKRTDAEFERHSREAAKRHEARLAELQEVVRVLQGTLAEKQGEIGQLEDELGAARAEIGQLTLKLQEAGLRGNALKVDAEALRVENSRLKVALAGVHHQQQLVAQQTAGYRGSIRGGLGSVPLGGSAAGMGPSPSSGSIGSITTGSGAGGGEEAHGSSTSVWPSLSSSSSSSSSSPTPPGNGGEAPSPVAAAPPTSQHQALRSAFAPQGGRRASGQGATLSAVSSDLGLDLLGEGGGSSSWGGAGRSRAGSGTSERVGAHTPASGTPGAGATGPRTRASSGCGGDVAAPVSGSSGGASATPSGALSASGIAGARSAVRSRGFSETAGGGGGRRGSTASDLSLSVDDWLDRQAEFEAAASGGGGGYRPPANTLVGGVLERPPLTPASGAGTPRNRSSTTSLTSLDVPPPLVGEAARGRGSSDVSEPAPVAPSADGAGHLTASTPAPTGKRWWQNVFGGAAASVPVASAAAPAAGKGSTASVDAAPAAAASASPEADAKRPPSQTGSPDGKAGVYSPATDTEGVGSVDAGVPVSSAAAPPTAPAPATPATIPEARKPVLSSLASLLGRARSSTTASGGFSSPAAGAGGAKQPGSPTDASSSPGGSSGGGWRRRRHAKSNATGTSLTPFQSLVLSSGYWSRRASFPDAAFFGLAAHASDAAVGAEATHPQRSEATGTAPGAQLVWPWPRFRSLARPLFVEVDVGGGVSPSSKATRFPGVPVAVAAGMGDIPLLRSLDPAERALFLRFFVPQCLDAGEQLKRVTAVSSAAACGLAPDEAPGSESGSATTADIAIIVAGSLLVVSTEPPLLKMAAPSDDEALPAVRPGHVFPAGSVVVLDTLPLGCSLLARENGTYVAALGTHSLTRALRWCASARRVAAATQRGDSDRVGGSSSASSDGASGTPGATGAAVLTTSGGEVPDDVQGTAAARLRALIATATTRAEYTAALRRWGAQLTALPLPPEHHGLHAAISATAGAAAPSALASAVSAYRRDVEQALRDLTREYGVILNAKMWPLGTAERLNAFLEALYATVVECVLGGAAEGSHAVKHGGAGSVDGDSSSADAQAPRTRRQQLALAVLCDILLAACRTVTGGDSYAQCYSLFTRPGDEPLAFLAAEQGAPHPVEVIMAGTSVTVVSVNTFKVTQADLLSPDAAGGLATGGGEDGRGSSTATSSVSGLKAAAGRLLGRARAATASLTSGAAASAAEPPASSSTSSGAVTSTDTPHVNVWALLRCTITETLHYAAEVGQQEEGEASASSTSHAWLAPAALPDAGATSAGAVCGAGALHLDVERTLDVGVALME